MRTDDMPRLSADWATWRAVATASQERHYAARHGPHETRGQRAEIRPGPRLQSAADAPTECASQSGAHGDEDKQAKRHEGSSHP